jgi:hypothetical protein
MTKVISRNGKEISKEVPQGLVLRQLLFIIYINDLSLCINTFAKVFLFVDDTVQVLAQYTYVQAYEWWARGLKSNYVRILELNSFSHITFPYTLHI